MIFDANDAGQLILRLTWGLLGEIGGFILSYFAVELQAGKLEKWEDVILVKTETPLFGFGGALTFGSKVMGQGSGWLDHSDPDLQAFLRGHEEGHYRQSITAGPLYLMIAVLSFFHAIFAPQWPEYFDFCVESDANRLGNAVVDKSMPTTKYKRGP